jgi:hypothetical protein
LLSLLFYHPISSLYLPFSISIPFCGLLHNAVGIP